MVRNYSYLPPPVFFPCSASVSHPKLHHLLPYGAERWGVEAAVSPSVLILLPHTLLLLQPGALLWALGIQAPARVLCRGCSPSGTGCFGVGPFVHLLPGACSCSVLLLRAPLQGIQWDTRKTSSFFSFSSSPSLLAAHRAFPHSFLTARQRFSLSYPCGSGGVPPCPVAGLLEPAVSGTWQPRLLLAEAPAAPSTYPRREPHP